MKKRRKRRRALKEKNLPAQCGQGAYSLYSPDRKTRLWSEDLSDEPIGQRCWWPHGLEKNKGEISERLAKES